MNNLKPKQMKQIIEKLKQPVEVSKGIEPPNWGVFISTPQAEAIIQALEQLERIWGRLATAEQDFELCFEENKRLKELLTEIAHRLLYDVDLDGNSNSDMSDLLTMWGNVQQILQPK